VIQKQVITSVCPEPIAKYDVHVIAPASNGLVDVRTGVPAHAQYRRGRSDLAFERQARSAAQWAP
jgi:hypothetical protein